MPPGPVAAVFGAYFAHVVPWVGGIISGDPMAYRYLPASVKAFPDARRLSAMFREAGLRRRFVQTCRSWLRCDPHRPPRLRSQATSGRDTSVGSPPS